MPHATKRIGWPKDKHGKAVYKSIEDALDVISFSQCGDGKYLALAAIRVGVKMLCKMEPEFKNVRITFEMKE